MAKFDLEKYWDFRVWVKSQIAQLRALLNEYQQNGGGGGTGGGSGSSDFNPAGTYPNMTVGNATKAVSANTAGYATNAGKAETATIADTATKANTATTASTATLALNLQSAPVLNADGDQITVQVGNKTSNALTVPFAERADFAKDLTGRIEATPEVFTYRPSAGEQSIKDDNAFIRRVKGNSIVWNQLVKNALDQSGNNGWWSRQGANNVELNGSSIKISFFVSGPNHTPQISQKIPLNANHTYFLTVNIDFNVSNDAVCYLREASDLYGDSVKTIIRASSDGHYNAIFTPTDGHSYLTVMFYRAINDVGDSVTVSDIQLIDLTAMFGAGNEPTTVEEFRELYPDSYYPYNAGELRNLDCSGIKTVGFNQWDEQWELGGLGTDEYGSPITFDGMIRSANYNPIFPSTEYYIRTSNAATYIWYYDSDKKYIGRDIKSNSRFFITPTNAAYFKLRIGDTTNTITTYNHDICINLHHTGYRDGDYEPYKEVAHSLPLSQITNGEPLRKAGSVYDEINETHYIKRVGVVDLGSLPWFQNTRYGFYVSLEALPGMQNATSDDIAANILCTKYITRRVSDILTQTNSIAVSTTHLLVGDLTYNNTSDFKTAMSGVMLNYELAEPIVTPIETPIDFNYYVEDFGTEEALLAEDSAPFSADIVYQFNATDQIRNNTRNIHKLEKSAFTPSGTSAQYIRGDGSYGDKVELSQSTPINNGEFETTDEGDMQFILTPNYYAKSQVTLDNTTTIAVFVTAPEDSYHLAEYWFEFAVDETLPNIEYYQPNNPNAAFRIDGDMMTDAVNILHLISSDGGNKFFGEIRSYSL